MKNNINETIIPPKTIYQNRNEFSDLYTVATVCVPNLFGILYWPFLMA